MTTREIDARVSSFVSELETLIRKAALEAVQAALGNASSPKAASAAPKPKKVAKPAAAKPTATAPEKAVAAAKPATSSSSSLPRVKKGARRSAEDVAAAARAIKAHLAANPGQGVEAIAKALGVPSKDLALPIINLLGAKSIRKEGEKRGTRYFVGGASEGKAAVAPEAPKAAAAAPAAKPASAPKKADKPAKGKKGKKK